MRNRILVAAVLTVAVGAGAAESVATSPECERWIADYRQKLAQSRPVEAVQKQRGRWKHYVHRQIAEVRHKPAVVRTSAPRDPLRPRSSPQSMVKRFQVLCGDLPPVQTAQLLPPVPVAAPPITPLAQPSTTPLAGTPSTPAFSPATPGTPINTPPVRVSDAPPPPVSQPPAGGGSLPPASPVPPVPEPSTLALLLVGGLAGAAVYKKKVA